MDHFYPAPASAPEATPGAVARAAQVAGEYQRNTFGGSVTTVEKARRLLGQGNRHIVAAGDGSLRVSTIGGETRFVEVAPDFYQEVGGQDRLLVRRDARGAVTVVMFGGQPVYTYERLAWPERPAAGLALIGACALVFGATLLINAARWVRDRLQPNHASRDGLTRLARWLAGGMTAPHLLFLAGLPLLLGGPATLMGDVTWLRALLALPLLGTALAVGVVITALAWRRRRGSLAARLHYVALTLAALAFTWALVTWNLLGFRV